VCKVFKIKDLSLYFEVWSFALKCESPAGLPGFLYLYFYCSELRETKMPVLAIFFLGVNYSFCFA
jgi:hypothetical protein